MSAKITSIDITIKNYRCFSDENPARILISNGFTGLVGVNNSGKSTFLKLLYELRNMFSNLSTNTKGLLNSLKNLQAFEQVNTVKDIEELFCNTNNREISFDIKVTAELNGNETKGELPDSIVVTIPRGTNQYSMDIVHRGAYLKVAQKDTIISPAPYLINYGGTLINLEPYHLAFQLLANTIYIGPFRNAINIGGNENYYDITVGQQFITLWDNLKAGSTKKNSTAALNLTNDIKDIFGFQSLEINANKENQSLIVIVDEKPYNLEELGSGLAQFILILASVAAKRPSWILIDEPELNLHPSLQIDFLTTLSSYSTEGIIFSTHNIGLARACAERIYSFRLDDKNRGEVRDFEATLQLSEFLGELSFGGYLDLGFDKLLLVEGPTEVRTIQQLLRKYRKDHEVVLLPLGGSSLIKDGSEHELYELKRITKNVYALIDSERKARGLNLSRDRRAFVETCANTGVNCHVLERRAMENYMTDRAVKASKGAKYRSLGQYEKLSDASPSWGKRENWRIAREMTQEELDATDLGVFLKSL